MEMLRAGVISHCLPYKQYQGSWVEQPPVLPAPSPRGSNEPPDLHTGATLWDGMEPVCESPRAAVFLSASCQRHTGGLGSGGCWCLGLEDVKRHSL